MENKKLLKNSGLLNPDINHNPLNYDLLSSFLSRLYGDSGFGTSCFSAVGYSLNEENRISIIEFFIGLDFLEVFNHVYHDSDTYGNTFCILHHDLSGFHYLIF